MLPFMMEYVIVLQWMNTIHLVSDEYGNVIAFIV